MMHAEFKQWTQQKGIQTHTVTQRERERERAVRGRVKAPAGIAAAAAAAGRRWLQMLRVDTPVGVAR